MAVLSKIIFQHRRKRRKINLLLAIWALFLIYYYCTSWGNSDKLSDRTAITNNQKHSLTTQSTNAAEHIRRIKSKGVEESYDNIVYDENGHEDRFFPAALPSKLIDSFDFLRISGFEYCSILNNARFNPWVQICKFL
jgi:hypothetical protein